MTKQIWVLNLLGALCLSHPAFAKEVTKYRTLVLCSVSSPRAQGFELIRISPKKDTGSGMHTVDNTDISTGGILYKGVYDVSLSRLKIKVVQVDEDGEEGQFLTSIDAMASSGEHMRVIFVNPAQPGKKSEQVELVCNVVRQSL